MADKPTHLCVVTCSSEPPFRPNEALLDEAALLPFLPDQRVRIGGDAVIALLTFAGKKDGAHEAECHNLLGPGAAVCDNGSSPVVWYRKRQQDIMSGHRMAQILKLPLSIWLTLSGLSLVCFVAIIWAVYLTASPIV